MRTLTFAEAIREAIREEMLKSDAVILMGEDIGRLGGTFKVLDGLWKEFGPDRVLEAPISEEAIVGMACGAALAGMRPVFEIMYNDFLCLAMDPLANHAAKLRYMTGGEFCVPMVIRTQEGGRTSQGPQHSQCLEAMLCHVPGLKVVMPSTPADAKGLLKTAIWDGDPVVFIEHKFLYSRKGEVPEGEYQIPFGAASVRREGSDVTIVAFSDMVNYALDAADDLDREGISAEVIDPRTLVPLDEAAICSSVRKTGRLIITHEAVRRGGFGAEIASLVVERIFHALKAPIRIVAAQNTPLAFSPSRATAVGYGAMPELVEVLGKCKDPLEEIILPQRHQIVQAARDLMA